MTNMEYYREQIEAITNNGDSIALDRHCGELQPCESMQCNNCIFLREEALPRRYIALVDG